MKAEPTPQVAPTLRERVQEWSALPDNALGGVGDTTNSGRSITEIKAEREKLRSLRQTK